MIKGINMDKKVFRIITIVLIIDSILLGCITINVYRKSRQPAAVTTLATGADTASLYVASESTTELTTEATTEEFTISMNFVGDLLLATNHEQAYENCFNEVADREDPSYFLSNVSDIFLNDDITVGDCENVFSDSENFYISDKGQDAAQAEYEAACAAAQAAGRYQSGT